MQSQWNLITEIKIIIKKKLNQLLQPVLSLENCFWGRVNFFIKLGPKIVDSQQKILDKKKYTHVIQIICGTFTSIVNSA